MPEKRKTVKNQVRRKNNNPSLVSSIKASTVAFFNKHTIICIFLILYFAYNTIFIVNTNGDTIPASFLPVSILDFHNMYFDQFGEMAINADTNYGFLLINGHYYSLFPVVTPILVTPVYAVSLILFQVPLGSPYRGESHAHLQDSSRDYCCSFWSFCLSGLQGIIFKKNRPPLHVHLCICNQHLVDQQPGTLAAGYGNILLIAMLYCVVRNEKTKSLTNIVALGVLSGLFVFNRPPDALLAIPIVYYIIRSCRDHLKYYVTCWYCKRHSVHPV